MNETIYYSIDTIHMAIDQLRNQLGDERMDYLLETFQKLQTTAFALLEKSDKMDMTSVKMVTITTLCLIDGNVIPRWYSEEDENNYHNMYIGAIEKVLVKEH